MIPSGVEDGSVNGEQIRIAQSGVTYLVGYIAVSAAAYSVVDILFFEEDALYFFSSVFVWAVGYVLLVMLMRCSAPNRELLRGGIGGYFGLGIISNFAIGIGFLMLVVPGLYLTMRWLPAFARLSASGDGVIQALSWSWEATASHQKELALALIGPMLTLAMFVGIIAVQEIYLLEASSLTLSLSFIAMNIFVGIFSAWMQLLGVAVYRMIEREQAAPVDVFS